MISVRGIYNNIEESSISLEYKDYKLYFSSEFNSHRFMIYQEDYFKRYTSRLNRIMKMDYELLVLISFYKRIEKRGFRVYYKGNRIKDIKINMEV